MGRDQLTEGCTTCAAGSRGHQQPQSWAQASQSHTSIKCPEEPDAPGPSCSSHSPQPVRETTAPGTQAFLGLAQGVWQSEPWEGRGPGLLCPLGKRCSCVYTVRGDTAIVLILTGGVFLYLCLKIDTVQEDGKWLYVYTCCARQPHGLASARGSLKVTRGTRGFQGHGRIRAP